MIESLVRLKENCKMKNNSLLIYVRYLLYLFTSFYFILSAFILAGLITQAVIFYLKLNNKISFYTYCWVSLGLSVALISICLNRLKFKYFISKFPRLIYNTVQYTLKFLEIISYIIIAIGWLAVASDSGRFLTYLNVLLLGVLNYLMMEFQLHVYEGQSSSSHMPPKNVVSSY